MLFIKKSKESLNEKCVNEIVFAYFSFLKDSSASVNITGEQISELLRYSICSLFDLETKGYSRGLMELSKSVCNVLRPIAQRYKLFNQTTDYHKGLLEACVHCMEMSRKRAGV